MYGADANWAGRLRDRLQRAEFDVAKIGMSSGRQKEIGVCTKWRRRAVSEEKAKIYS
jgi:hypothetical protein